MKKISQLVITSALALFLFNGQLPAQVMVGREVPWNPCGRVMAAEQASLFGSILHWITDWFSPSLGLGIVDR